jgi:FkbM family methyltransferase
MKFDYVDIGTSDFDIGRGGVISGKKYLLVEPIQYYLGKLKENEIHNDNVLMCNAAITNHNGYIDVWYLKEEIQKLHNLPYWVRGCNRVNEKHPTVERLLKNHNISEDVWSCEKVRCMTFQMLCEENCVEEIGSLKIDTEGHDHIVLEGVIAMLRSGLEIREIMCEYFPEFENTKMIEELCEGIKDLFPLQRILGENIHLSK